MVREENEKDPKGEMTDWDDQADAVVGVAQGDVSQSSAIPAVITPISNFNARLPAPVLLFPFIPQNSHVIQPLPVV